MSCDYQRGRGWDAMGMAIRRSNPEAAQRLSALGKGINIDQLYKHLGLTERKRKSLLRLQAKNPIAFILEWKFLEAKREYRDGPKLSPVKRKKAEKKTQQLFGKIQTLGGKYANFKPIHGELSGCYDETVYAFQKTEEFVEEHGVTVFEPPTSHEDAKMKEEAEKPPKAATHNEVEREWIEKNLTVEVPIGRSAYPREWIIDIDNGFDPKTNKLVVVRSYYQEGHILDEVSIEKGRNMRICVWGCQVCLSGKGRVRYSMPMVYFEQREHKTRVS